MVLTIDDYGEEYGIKDRNRAGGEPRCAEQRHEKEQIERDVEERNDRLTAGRGTMTSAPNEALS